MHANSHSLIALAMGAISVNITTPIDMMFTSHTIACLLIFCAKGVIGAAISIGINLGYDYWKNKNKK